MQQSEAKTCGRDVLQGNALWLTLVTQPVRGRLMLGAAGLMLRCTGERAAAAAAAATAPPPPPPPLLFAVSLKTSAFSSLQDCL